MTQTHPATPEITSENAPAPKLAHDIRLIALDIDGTLLNSRHEMSERTRKAIKAAIDKGVQIIIATGKTRNAVKYVHDQLGVPLMGIFLQGLATHSADGAVMYQQTLDAQIARQIVTYADDRGFTVIAYHGERLMMRAFHKDAEEATTQYHEPLPEVVGPLQNMLGTVPINKLLIVGDPRAITALRWQLNVQHGGSIRLMQAGLANMLEVLPPGSSKGAALKTLLRDLKIAPEHVMAMGDAENDIEMIKLAGVGIAMGHAAQKVKDAARYIAKTHDEDGVAEMVERYVLGIDPDAPMPTVASAPGAESSEKPVIILETPAAETPSGEPATDSAPKGDA